MANDPAHDTNQQQRAADFGRPFFRVLMAVALGVALAWIVLPGEDQRPNVVLITIDTLRADAPGPEDMPELWALASRGRRFLSARTPAPLTLPGHVSLLAGLLPAAHGIRDNTARALAPRDRRGFTLLAEEFSDAGYATAAFVASSVLDPRFRLDAGFDQYRHPPPPRKGALVWESRSGSEQAKRFADWHATRPEGQRFFAWVHLWDPHDPYRAYEGDERRAGTAEQDPPALRYKGETRRADAALEAILSLVDRERTVVVVTSDHGESLGEHGEKTHGYLCYGATMNVPLVIAHPGVAAGVDDRACSLVDIAPTLRSLCGLDAQNSDGFDLFDPDAAQARVIAGESLYAYRLFHWAQQQVAFDGRMSLVDGGPALELFDLAADPGETTPLADPELHPSYARLDRALMEYRGREQPGEAGEGQTPYGSPYGSKRIAFDVLLPVKENRQLPPVAAGLPRVALLDRLKGLIAMGHAGAVRALLPEIEAFEREDPANPAPVFHRGRALLHLLKEPAAAALALEEARRRGYDDAEVLGMLLEAYRRAGDESGIERVKTLLGE